MLRNANSKTQHDSRHDPADYIKRGYIPVEHQEHSACS